MENIKCAYSEVYEIINLMSYDLRSKIPSKFINLIMTQKDENYIPQIARNIPLEEQNLREETISILAYLKLNCFCDNEEKKQFMKMLNENERKYQEELRDKYNPDDLFKKDNVEQYENTKREVTNQDMQMIRYQKESFFVKIFNKLKNFFENRK